MAEELGANELHLMAAALYLQAHDCLRAAGLKRAKKAERAMLHEKAAQLQALANKAVRIARAADERARHGRK